MPGITNLDELEIKNLNARHRLEMDTLMQKHAGESKQAIREAVETSVERVRSEMEQQHRDETARKEQAMKDECNAKLKHVENEYNIKLKDALESAVNDAVDAKEKTLTNFHDRKMKEVVDELTSSFQLKERQIITDAREKFDKQIAAAVANAIEKTVNERECLKKEIAQLKSGIKAYEEQLASHEQILGWGKSSSGFADGAIESEDPSKTNISAKQAAAGYTRLLASWRQKVFQLLIHKTHDGTITAAPQISPKESTSDVAVAGPSQQQTVPVLQAKLEYAQSEWNKLKNNEDEKIRLEERIKFLSQTCVDLKEDKATQENKITSLNSEIATFRTIENEYRMLKNLSHKNEEEYKNTIKKYNDLLGKGTYDMEATTYRPIALTCICLMSFSLFVK